MFGLDPVGLGIALALAALGLLGLAAAVLRASSKGMITPFPVQNPRAEAYMVGAGFNPDLEEHGDAALLIAPGGRLVFLNATFREWFHLSSDDLPNLEYLARRSHPSETFLNLCAAQGRGRFSLQGLLVEGISYHIPYQEQRGTLVILHRPALGGQTIDHGKEKTNGSLPQSTAGTNPSLIAELSQALRLQSRRDSLSDNHVEATLQVVMEHVDQLVPADLAQATVWDEARGHFSPYTFVGLPGIDRRIERTQPLQQGMGGAEYRQQLLDTKTSLLITDVDHVENGDPALRAKGPALFKSFLAIPLLIGDDLVGTIELASLKRNAFDAASLNMLQSLSGQAAAALNNAMTFQAEERLAAELSGLADLTNTIGALDDQANLLAKLVERIQLLLDVNLIGFLLYDETQNILAGCIPFVGLQDQFVEWYRAELPPRSAAEDIWLSRQVIVADNAPDDETLQTLGLAHLAQAAGIQRTALVPLMLSGRSLGYMQAGDKHDGTPFYQGDLRLMSIIAGWVAPVIANSRLSEAVRRQTQHAEVLRRVANLANSDAALDEVLTLSLIEIARPLHADRGAIYLMAEDHSALRLHKPSVLGFSPRKKGDLIPQTIPTEDPRYTETVTNTLQIAAGDRLPAVYQPIVNALSMESCLIIPIIRGEKGIGEIILGSTTGAHYNHANVELASAAAIHLAGAIERTHGAPGKDHHLVRRVEELTSLARISRELNTTTNLGDMLRLAHQELVYNTNADNGSILIFKFEIQDDRIISLTEDGMPRIGTTYGTRDFDGFTEVELQALTMRTPVLLENYEGSSYHAPRQGIGTSLVFPLLYQDNFIGLAHIYAKTPGRFDNDAVETGQSIMAQVGIATGKIIRDQAHQGQSEQFRRGISRLSSLLTPSALLGINGGSETNRPIEAVLSRAILGLKETLQAGAAWFGIYDANLHVLRWLNPDHPTEPVRSSRPGAGGAATITTWKALEERLSSQNIRGKTYIVPTRAIQGIVPDAQIQIPTPEQQGTAAVELALLSLILPLYAETEHEHPLGLVLVNISEDTILSDFSFQTLELFGAQLAVALQGHQQVSNLKAELENLRREVYRAGSASQQAAQQLPFLLRKDLEQSLTLAKIQEKSRRIHAGLEIVETISRQTNRDELVKAFAKAIAGRMRFDMVLAAKDSPRGPVLINRFGVMPEHINPDALIGQRNPIRHVMRTGVTLAIANLERSPGSEEWRGSPLLAATGASSFVCFPILRTNEEDARPSLMSVLMEDSTAIEVEAAILAIGREPIGEFTLDDLEIFAAISRQASTTLRSIYLREETTKRLQEVDLLLNFSRQLSSLDAEATVTTLVESALQVITAASAAHVGLWDPGTGRLAVKAASGYLNNAHMMQIQYRAGEGLPGQVLHSSESRLIEEVNLVQEYNLSPENLSHYQEAVGAYVPISCIASLIKAAAPQGKGHALGVLVLDNFNTPGAFTNDDLLLISSLTQQAGLILENIQLMGTAGQRAAQLEALTHISSAITSNLQVETVIANLLEQLRTVIPYETGTLWVRDGNKITVRAASGFEGDEPGEARIGLTANVEDSRLVSEMVETGQPIYVSDVFDDARFFAHDAEATNRSWLGIPLLQLGEVRGVIALEKKEPDFYTGELIQLAVTFANQAAIALENARLFEESIERTLQLDERTQRLGLLNRLSTRLGSTLDLTILLQIAMDDLSQTVHGDRVSIVMFEEDGLPVLQAETPALDIEKLPTALPQAALFDHLKETGGIFSSGDITSEALLAGLAPFLEERGTISLLALPLRAANEFQGVVLIHGSDGRFPSSEVEVATTISNQAAVAIENARLYQRAQGTLVDLATRERYQKGVAEAIIVLNERGTDALNDVLNALGVAADCTRAFYFESLRNEEGPFWRLVAEWSRFDVVPMQQAAEWIYLPHKEAGDWADQLAGEGQVTGLISDFPPEFGERLASLGIESISLTAVTGGETIPGFMGIAEDTYARNWREDELEALRTIAAALSTNLEQDKLLRQIQTTLAGTEEQARRLALLNTLSTELNGAETIDTILQTACEITRLVLEADHASVHLLSHDSLTISAFAISGETGDMAVGEMRQVTNLAGEIIDSSIFAGTGGPHAPAISEQMDPLTRLRTTMYAPLFVRDTAFGLLVAGSKFQSAFNTADQTIITQVTSLVTAAIDNRQLLDETQRLTAELEERVIERTRQLETEHSRTQTLLAIITELSGSLDMDIVLNRTLELINGIVAAEYSTIMLSSTDQPGLSERASLGFARLPKSFEETANNLSNWVIKQREPLLIDDLGADVRWAAKKTGEKGSAMVVPLMMGEDILGTLLLFHQEARHFNREQLDLVQATAKQIAVAINNAQLFLLIRDQAERLGAMMRTQQVEANRLRAILEAVADGVLVTDAAGKISIFNASAEGILNLPAKDVIGKSLDRFTGFFGSAGQRWTRTITNWSNDPTALEIGEIYSERITLDNGHYVAVNLAPVSWRNEFLGTVSIFRDITHQVEVDRLKSEFVANVSHELRTPMTSIKGYVDILLMGAAGTLPDTAQNFLNVIKNNADRLTILVNDLLDVSRIDAGRYTFVIQPVQVNELLLKVINNFSERARQDEREMTFIYQPNSNLPRVNADPERLRQVIENLIENAYTYTPAGGRIEARTAVDDNNMMQIDIQDNGIGISPENQNRIFERFFRGEDALVLASAGTGLGLSIVQYLVEIMNGKIWFESEGIPGSGSTFSFVIPLYLSDKM